MREGLFSETTKGIVIAADVLTIEDLKRLVKVSCGVSAVVAIKVGFSLALRYGLPTIVSAIKDVSELPVIYDHQKAGTDIPAMGKAFAMVCYEAGVQGVIVFPQAGPKTQEAFISAINESGLTPIIGLVMTHPAYLQSEGGFILDNAPDMISRIAIDFDVKHFVLPGTKTDIVKEFAQGALAAARPAALLMPGIGSQGGSIAETFAAAEGHHPYAIIGSAVYKADNPLEALRNFATEVGV